MSWPSQFSGVAAVKDSFPSQPLHLAIGMFDGVHLGHRAVINAAVQSARRSSGLAAVLTFWPHPSALFRPDSPTRLLMDEATRTRALLQLGVDAVIIEPFTPDFMHIKAEDFLPHLRRHLPRLAAVYVGENFRFGQGRQGDVGLLVAAGHRLALQVFSSPRVNFNGEPVSSSRIRAALADGRMEEVNAMLGRTYATTGAVVPGRQLGRTLGFPTLNLPWSPDSRPRLGVYAVRVTGEKSSAPLPAVANYGLRPTVEAAATGPLLEVHVQGDCPFREEDWITVEWLSFLRPEQKFSALSALSVQIAHDCEAATKFHDGG